MTLAIDEAKPGTLRGKTRGLFKTDYPRAIDRYIDYFGGPSSDPCGEALLDSFDDSPAEGEPTGGPAA